MNTNDEAAPQLPLDGALADTEAAVALWHGPDLALAYANRACQEMFGWPAGVSLRKVKPDQPALTAAAERVRATGAPSRVDETAIGATRTACVVCSPVRGPAGGSASGPAGGDAQPGVLMVAVDTTAQAHARRSAEDRSERLTVLDQATLAVTTDRDPRQELVALVDSVVPAVADACAVYLIDQSPRGRAVPERIRATRLACAIDPASGVAPPPPEVRLAVAATRPVARAVAGGQAVLAHGDELELPEWGERWLNELAPHSLVAVPLGDSGVVAVVSFAAAGSRPPYQESDVALMREITARAGAVVSRGLQLQQANEVALVLQRGLLSDPAKVGWLDIAVRYRPAVPDLEVGGDWYDTITLPDGRLGLAVGDVVGHDLFAVNTMGQLRSMLRALACQPSSDPAGVLTALNQLSSHLSTGNLATVVYGCLDRSNGGPEAVLTWAAAGHPPPLLIAPDGAVTVLEGATSPLLGILDLPYRQSTVPVTPGSLLLLYTDGLIEDPARPRDDPITELAAAAGELAGLSPEHLCDKLLANAPSADDIALLALRVR